MAKRSRWAAQGVRSAAVLLAAAFLCLLAVQGAVAQRVVNISPGFGTINATIQGDTLGTGARVDSGTVYRLQRGGYYILNGTLEHRYPLIVEATPGTGPKPIIVQGVVGGGTAPAEAWAPRANLRMKNIYLSAVDELGGTHERIIRIRENNIRLVLDSCHLDVASQAGFRVDAVNAKIYFTNSIISNIGSGASPDNGRGIDDRGVDIDTLILENSTFYNLTSRVIRDAGGFIKYCRVNHCTMYNIGQYGITIGPAYSAVFTNNLMVNGGYYGLYPGVTRELLKIAPGPGSNPSTVLIANNNFTIDSAIATVYPDSVALMPLYDSLTQSYIQNGGTMGTIYNESMTFTNAPDPPVAVVTDFYTNGTVAPNPDLDTTGGPFNFGYSNTKQSYSRGSDGKPLGDLNWHGIPLLSVESKGEGTPESFALSQNFPNPFNPTTRIEFALVKGGMTTLTVYDLLGKEVQTLVREELAAGTYAVRFDAAGLASGTYVYVISSGGARLSQKMMVLK